MSEPDPIKPLRLGDLLVSRGLITSDQLAIALTEQKRADRPLGETLIALGFVSEAGMSESLAENLGEEAIPLKGIAPSYEALALIPKTIAQRHAIFPVALDVADGTLLIATADPHDIVISDHVTAALAGKARPVWRLAARPEILSAIEQFYGHELSIDGILREIESGQIDIVSLTRAEGGYSHPVVRLIDGLLVDAVLRGASDLHFEPEGQFLRIRLRIDGVLRQARALHASFWSAMLVRLKVMAQMDIAETRAPQDGRISLTITGRQVDFRCAAQPTIHGENYVMRVLDRKRGIVPIDKIGLTEEQLALLKLMLSRPEGILLVTGPTGSGKTTTLYSILGHLNEEGVNIMTLEDPVEYPMALVRQTQVGEAAKINFAGGIRSLMRQDPDIILVGEIRDQETAEMAFRAAMTGHQVFSTLHTNSAIRSIPRLFDLGINAEVIAGNVIGIVAQRLVRRLCIECREPYAPSDFERRLVGLASNEPATLYRAKGCPRCGDAGFKGRMTVIEILPFDPGLDELVASRASLKKLNEYALSRNFVPIAEDGIRRVKSGETTLDEIARVVDLTDRIAH